MCIRDSTSADNASDKKEGSDESASAEEELLTGLHHITIDVQDYGTITLELDADEAQMCIRDSIDSDIRLAMTGNIRKYMAEHPDHFDPRQYLKPARQAVKDMVAHKIVNVLGSNGKA